MLREEILNMPAGREMDALIAEKVIREPKPTLPHDHANVLERKYSERGYWFCQPDFFKGDECEWEPRLFSTNIQAAWEVIQHFDTVRDGKACQVSLDNGYSNDPKEHWQCLIGWGMPGMDGYFDAEGLADTAPLAICRAALLAVMDINDA